MTIDELRELILSDPDALKLAQSGDDAGCAERCSTIAPKLRQPVSANDVMRHAALSGAWGAINLARESTTTPSQIKGICLTFVDWIKQGNSINFDLPEVQKMLGGLVQAGLVTTQQATGLSALGNVAQIVATADISEAVQQYRKDGLVGVENWSQ